MHIFVGSAIWREQSAENVNALIRLFRVCDARGIQISNCAIVGDGLVSRARSVVASEFLHSTADVLLTIDADIIFDPEDAISICEKARSHYIVGGLYMKRSDPTAPAGTLPDEDFIMADGFPLVPVRWLNSGFMAVDRIVLEHLCNSLPLCAQASEQSFWPFYQPMIVSDDKNGFLYLSEDWSFCERANIKSYRCYLDPTVRLGHLAQVELRVEDMLRTKRPPEQPLRLRRDDKGGAFIDVREEEVH